MSLSPMTNKEYIILILKHRYHYIKSKFKKQEEDNGNTSNKKGL
ncbi:MAG: hypothetical protein U9P90_01500 [Patescibacteria group bacterium]|nr:hypothetical protein [Patescibacteria group bacterium]